MDKGNATDHFSKDLTRLVDRYRLEYEMSYAELLGVLFLCAHDMAAEAGEN